MIRAKDVFSEAYGALRQNRQRTAITMLGMAWGIATVVLLLAYGTGFSTAIVNIFRAFASMQSAGIVGGRTSMQAGGSKAGADVRLTRDDLDRLVTNVPQVTRIAPESFLEARVTYEGRSYTWNVSGSTPVMPDIQNLKVDFGRFYNAEDMQLRGRVCALGSEAKEKLFSGRYPLGERIRINGIPYEVVGVMKARPKEGNDNTINMTSTDPVVDENAPPGTGTTIVEYPNATITLGGVKGCVNPGGKTTVRLGFKRSKKKGNVWIKVFRVDFSQNGKLLKKVTKPPFKRTIKVKATQRKGSFIEVRARAFIKVHHGKTPKKSVRVRIPVCT